MAKMPTPQPSQNTRINVGELKAQLARNLGPERFQRYFGFLNQFLMQKMSKSDLNKHCIPILGRENVPLHNQFIHSILTNAFQAKTPPPLCLEKGASKPIAAVGKKSSQRENILNHLAAPTSTSLRSNGHILPTLPCEVRSCIQDHKIKNHPSSLGLNGRLGASYHQSLVPLDEKVLREDGLVGPCDLKRPIDHHQCDSSERPAKRLWTENSTTNDLNFVDKNALLNVVAMEDGEELKRANDLNYNRGPLQAPLGIPFCPASVGGAQRALPRVTSSSGNPSNNYCCGELCHTDTLKRIMEKIAVAHGLEGVSLECSDVLNKGLDAYLKRLIGSCLGLPGTKLDYFQTRLPLRNQQAHLKPVNGVLSRYYTHIQNNTDSSERIQGLKAHSHISREDFRMAMKLNPQQLGEDWPFLLEKISFLSFEE